MFNKLQNKWKVKGWQLALILITFAIGGSFTGWLGRKLLGLTEMEHGVSYYILFVVTMTLIWPFAVLIISIPFGQYPFFIKYIKRIGGRMVGKSHARVVEEEEVAQVPGTRYRLSLIKIAIFASGAGSNAQKIIDHFRNSKQVKIALIVCNKPGAGVLSIAQNEKIASIIIEKEKFFRGDAYVSELQASGIVFIVLAGFLWKIPSTLIKAYSNNIINIHPALLPKYGGKGMYGHFVHEAVIAAGDSESGITIHYVDDQYDHGNTIFQAICSVFAGDTAATLAERILALEHLHFPVVIEQCLLKK